MEAFKIRKSEYSNLPKLLKRVGLVQGNEAFPSNYFVSQKTENLIRKELTKAFKKKYNYISDTKIKSSVGWELLTYGPVVVKRGIEFGYVLAQTVNIPEMVFVEEDHEALKLSEMQEEGKDTNP